jgi:hypothetical protein
MTLSVVIVMLSVIVSRSVAMTIAEDGKATAAVVVSDNSLESERYAAGELAKFLGEITDAKYEVVSSAPEGDRMAILIGPDAARTADPEFSTEGLGTDGIIIRTVGNKLILAGVAPRGTLYAVYSFLEDQLGCRWWSSKVSRIPRKKTIVVDTLDISHKPVLEYREPFWFDAFNPDWAVRNKCNGNTPALDAKRGGRHIYEGFVHTFNSLIPPETYFKDHPEWFSLINGKRTADHSQLCLTNAEMCAELVKNLKVRLAKNPAATIASVSQNDWHGNCQCPECAQIEEKEGSPAGLMLRFVNSVAQEIEPDFPNVAISTLAYQYTRKPPRLTKPRHNVIVRLCSIECSFSVPLSDERNKDFRDDLVGWSKIADRLYVWDYTTNFRHHIMPHPNLRVLGPNVRFFADHSVKGLFEQGAYTTNGAEMAELRAWVLAKMLWNPKLDGQKLIDEFLDGYYGQAAEHIRSYLKVTHDAVQQSGDQLGCFSPHTAEFLSFKVLGTGWKHLEEAEKAVKDDPDVAFRVRVAQLPVMYTFMMRWKEFRSDAAKAGAAWPMDESIKNVFDRFMRIARDDNVTRLNEWAPGYGALEEAVKLAVK